MDDNVIDSVSFVSNIIDLFNLNEDGYEVKLNFLLNREINKLKKCNNGTYDVKYNVDKFFILEIESKEGIAIIKEKTFEKLFESFNRFYKIYIKEEEMLHPLFDKKGNSNINKDILWQEQLKENMNEYTIVKNYNTYGFGLTFIDTDVTKEELKKPYKFNEMEELKQLLEDKKEQTWPVRTFPPYSSNFDYKWNVSSHTDYNDYTINDYTLKKKEDI